MFAATKRYNLNRIPLKTNNNNNQYCINPSF